MNIVLCGMMGAGKTRIGKTLATLTGKAFIDTDELIVKNHGRIADIFANYGEKYFRDLETETAEILSQKDELIIATGGGFVLRERNASLLKQKGVLVYLKADEQTLVQRLSADTERPLLQNGELLNKIRSLLQERAPVYEKIADYTVCVDNQAVEEIAKEIIKKVNKK